MELKGRLYTSRGVSEYLHAASSNQLSEQKNMCDSKEDQLASRNIFA